MPQVRRAAFCSCSTGLSYGLQPSFELRIFDPHGVLHVMDALAGVSAVPSGARVRATLARRRRPGLVGVAFDAAGNLVMATSDAVCRLTARRWKARASDGTPLNPSAHNC